MDSRPKTIICDIDGVLLHHRVLSENADPNKNKNMMVSRDTQNTLDEWDKKGYNIILITGRRESMRKNTEEQLALCGIFYDQLIMGVGGGVRILINDLKPDGSETAFAFNVQRNDPSSLKNLNL